MSDEDVGVVIAFNAAINDRDLARLAGLMAEDHRFVDVDGAIVDGKAACVEAWRGFFETFPNYRNVFDEVRADSDGMVVVRGRSECSTPELEGPARWRAVVADGLIAEWRVEDDRPS